MAKKAAASGIVFIVPKSPVKNFKIIVKGPKKWVAIDGKAHGRGSKIKWLVADSAPRVLKIEPPSIIVPGTLKIKGNRASAKIHPEAQPGYYEYVITVDGKFVEGGSAPGIIID
jgi:hypothetical protein